MSLPKSWQPVPAGGEVLLGPKGDGGYVVTEAAARAATLLLSMGLSDDWRFEEAFRNLTGARILCLDGTVNKWFWIERVAQAILRLRPARALDYLKYRKFFSRKGVEHRLTMIGYDRPGYSSLNTLLAEIDDPTVFLKIDIEGSEYRIFDQIVMNQHRFSGMALELHQIDLHRNRIDGWLKEMEQFQVTALHANNFGSIDPQGDPCVIEITLTRRDFLYPAENYSSALRISNNPMGPTIEPVFA